MEMLQKIFPYHRKYLCLSVSITDLVPRIYNKENEWNIMWLLLNMFCQITIMFNRKWKFFPYQRIYITFCVYYWFAHRIYKSKNQQNIAWFLQNIFCQIRIFPNIFCHPGWQDLPPFPPLQRTPQLILDWVKLYFQLFSTPTPTNTPPTTTTNKKSL